MLQCNRFAKMAIVLSFAFLAGCGGANTNASSNPAAPSGGQEEAQPSASIWDLFNRGSENSTVKVNRYLWAASLEVLNFLPVQSIDPFTGVIVTGYGTPTGGGRAYRATVLVDDPALDARSLNVALQTRGGRAVSKATSRAVEDAILSRARELRIADNRF